MGTEEYSRGNYAVLPADCVDLENIFTAQEYIDVATENNVYVTQSAFNEYSAFYFKDRHTTDVEAPTVIAKTRSTLAPSSSTVYLQIFNRTTATWETVDSDSTTAADTKFTLTATQYHNLDDYYDASKWLCYRIYQLDV
jgi:hypothetical protein